MHVGYDPTARGRSTIRVLVTGATGYLGQWAARELARRGHEVRGLARSSSDTSVLDGTGVVLFQGDVTEPDTLGPALEGCEAVVHAAGLARLRHRDRERLFAVNRDGTANVCAAAASAGVRRLIYLSSAGAMGGSMDPVPMDESWVSTTHEVGVDYFDSKLAGEEVARSWEAKGLEVVVARPGIVLGPGDKLGSSAGTILRMARGTLPASVPGGGSYCDVRDVAAALAEAVEGEHAGRTYVLGGHNVSMRDMARKVSDLTGVPPPRQVPYWLMIAVAFVLEVIAVIRGTRAPVSRQLVRGARRYTFMDCTRARNELGYTNRPLDETLRETLRFFLEVEMLKPSTPQLEALRAD